MFCRQGKANYSGAAHARVDFGTKNLLLYGAFNNRQLTSTYPASDAMNADWSVTVMLNCRVRASNPANSTI